MTLNVLIAVFALAGFLFLITAIRRFQLRHMSGGLFHGTSALVMFLVAAMRVADHRSICAPTSA